MSLFAPVSLPTLWPRRRVWASLIAALLVAPLSSHAARDEKDHYRVDEYRYDRDGSSVMSTDDDPGDGGPTPTDTPLGSDAASALVAVVGAWYARRALRPTSTPPG
ncbi:MAG: hypothetical protein H7330_13490 [Hymenobacteraceae bacterium]|nr:hypothetical protein [Hymenobacteraceae bacterium]